MMTSWQPTLYNCWYSGSHCHNNYHWFYPPPAPAWPAASWTAPPPLACCHAPACCHHALGCWGRGSRCRSRRRWYPSPWPPGIAPCPVSQPPPRQGSQCWSPSRGARPPPAPPPPGWWSWTSAPAGWSRRPQLTSPTGGNRNWPPRNLASRSDSCVAGGPQSLQTRWLWGLWSNSNTTQNMSNLLEYCTKLFLLELTKYFVTSNTSDNFWPDIDIKEKNKLEKMRSSSVASFCLQPNHVLNFWIITLLHLFILSPIL